MRKIFIYAALFINVWMLWSFCLADDDILQKIVNQVNKWAVEQPQEKVYMQLDKPYYAVGDDIWFKAYVTLGGKHQLSALSGVLNVELINDRDSIKKALKLPIEAGVAWGDIKLSDSLFTEGSYHIRAYTNYMRNAGSDYFFDQTIVIGNAITNSVFTKVKYTYAPLENGHQKVKAVITYTDVDGKPYPNSEVDYDVKLNAQSVIKGKGLTDEQGNLTVNYVNNSPAQISYGTIVTGFKPPFAAKVIKNIPINVMAGKVDVQFFPESGSLINGIRTRVAFKAINANGLGVDIKGIVVDNKNQQITEIKTQHLGMGVFFIVPEAGNNYYAKLTYPDGTIGTVPLPATVNDGYVMNVYNADPNHITVKISAGNISFQKDQNTDMYLVAQSCGNIIYTSKTKLTTPTYSTQITKSRFPTGITQFTLFSNTGQPLNERIIFIQNLDELKFTLNTAKTTYTPREKVKLDFAVQNKNNQPVTGSFSVSVIDESKLRTEEMDESTILSNILLTSDIKGYIEKPNYYFTNISEKTTADLDVLMLTQGYRRFDWKKIISNDFPLLAFQPEKSISISGYIKTPGGKPVPKAKVMLLSNKGGLITIDTVADETGHFSFDNLMFTDDTKFLVKARNAKGGERVEVIMDKPLPQAITSNNGKSGIWSNNTDMEIYLQNSKKQYDEFLKYGMIKKNHILKEVAINEKKPELRRTANLNGDHGYDYLVKADKLFCPTLSGCLIGLIPGVTVKKGVAYSNKYSGPMLIVLDGTPMFDMNLDDLNINDILSIEALTSLHYAAIYGSRGSNGVLVVTTKQTPEEYAEGMRTASYTPGIAVFNAVGFYAAREFYSPRYDDPKANVKVADLRTTIYWKPNIITDKEGNASVEFFNADSPGTYKVTVEGIDADGNIGRQIFRYKVQ